MADTRKGAAELSKQSTKAGEVAAKARRNPDANGLLGLLKKFEACKSDLERLPLSAHTRRAYKTRLQHFLGFLGSCLDEYPDALANRHTRDYVARDFIQFSSFALILLLDLEDVHCEQGGQESRRLLLDRQLFDAKGLPAIGL